jgi:hypothetical protein
MVPFRNFSASGPATRTTPRSGRSAIFASGIVSLRWALTGGKLRYAPAAKK